MFSRAFDTPQPRHARLFELLRQAGHAELVRARQRAPDLDAKEAEHFLKDAWRSWR